MKNGAPVGHVQWNLVICPWYMTGQTPPMGLVCCLWPFCLYCVTWEWYYKYTWHDWRNSTGDTALALHVTKPSTIPGTSGPTSTARRGTIFMGRSDTVQQLGHLPCKQPTWVWSLELHMVPQAQKDWFLSAIGCGLKTNVAKKSPPSLVYSSVTQPYRPQVRKPQKKIPLMGCREPASQ